VAPDEEIATVRARGVEISPETLMIASTPLILPMHGELDRAREEKASSRAPRLAPQAAALAML
jgi:adenylosuccinate synthase